MVTFMDLVESGCTIQGAVEVTTLVPRPDGNAETRILFSGEGEDIPASGYDEYGDAEIAYIYHDRTRDVLCVELCWED